MVCQFQTHFRFFVANVGSVVRSNSQWGAGEAKDTMHVPKAGAYRQTETTKIIGSVVNLRSSEAESRWFEGNEVEDVRNFLMTSRSTELVNSTVAEVGGRGLASGQILKDSLSLGGGQAIGIYVGIMKSAVCEVRRSN